MNDWSSRDRNLAVALDQYDASICGGCGQSLHESTDDDGPMYDTDNRQCRGCLVLSNAGSENDEPGTQWFVKVMEPGVPAS